MVAETLDDLGGVSSAPLITSVVQLRSARPSKIAMERSVSKRVTLRSSVVVSTTTGPCPSIPARRLTEGYRRDRVRGETSWHACPPSV